MRSVRLSIKTLFSSLNRIGGDIKQIAWDPTGQRLAVSFRSKWNSFMTLILSKRKRELMDPFHLVTVYVSKAWANSRIQHVPFYIDKLNQADEPINLGKKLVSNILFLP